MPGSLASNRRWFAAVVSPSLLGLGAIFTVLAESDSGPDKGGVQGIVRVRVAHVLLTAALILSVASCNETQDEPEPAVPAPAPSPTETFLEPIEPPRVVVPDVEGENLRRALRILKRADLTARIRKRGSSETIGTVLSQRPPSGIEVRLERSIGLEVAIPASPVGNPGSPGAEHRLGR
jgi:PASTA domain